MSDEQVRNSDQKQPMGVGSEQHSQSLSGVEKQAPDGILDTLADLENRLGNLKSMHAQSAAKMQLLLKQESELTQREEELARREEESSKRESGLVERETLLEQRVEEWRQTVTQVENQQKKLGDLEKSLTTQRGEIDELRRRLEVDARQTQSVAARNQDFEQELKKREVSLHAQIENLARREQEVVQGKAELAQSRAEVAQRQAETAQRQSEFERWAAEHKAEIDRQIAAARQGLRDIEVREKVLADRAAALEAKEQTLEETRQRHEAELEKSRAEIRSREDAVEQESARLTQLKAELESLQGRLDQQRRAFEQESEVARSDIQKRQEEIKAAEADLSQRQAQIKARLEELDRARAAVSEQERTLLAQAQDDGEAGAIASGRVEMLQIQIGEANAKRAAVERELAQIKTEAQGLREQLEKIQANGDAEKLRVEVEKRDHAIMLLRDRFAQLNTAYKALQEQVSKAGEGQSAAPSQSADDERLKAQMHAGGRTRSAGVDLSTFNVLRRERLRRYKTLLQQQARKIVAAQAGLNKKLSECDQILAQRSKLGTIAQELASKEQRVEKAKARSGLGMVLIGLAMVACVMGVLSWQATIRIWPGRYVAQAVIEADAHGRTPEADELGQWQKYHEELVNNPQFLEVAAERMNRRGIASLGRAADLSAKVKNDVYVESPSPGVLTIELTGEGQDKAEQILDTLVTSLKSVSDAAREQRAEDLGVQIVQVAKAGDHPTNEKQLVGFAGGMFGGMMLAVMLFGAVIWSRLVNAKRKFDQSQAVEQALGDVDWASMEQALKRSTAEASKKIHSR